MTKSLMERLIDATGLKITGWVNVGGSGNRSKCKCGSWKNHWVNFNTGMEKSFPSECSVSGCTKKAKDGAHIKNPNEEGEWIVPMCEDCNHPSQEKPFNLRRDVHFASANRNDTCE